MDKREGVAAAVKEVLARRGLTLGQAAIKTGLSKSILSRIKNAQTMPTRNTLLVFAVGLREPVAQLLEAAGYAPVEAETVAKWTELSNNHVSPETPSSAPQSASDARDGILVPPDVQKVIAEALERGDEDAAIEEAWWFARRPEYRRYLDFDSGAKGGDSRTGRLRFVRVWEDHAGVKLLPDNIIF